VNDGPQDNDSQFYPQAEADPEMVEFAEFIASISREFDDRTMQRHEMGGQKYGPGKFLVVDTLEEALDEILDLANYARYTFIKLRLLQERLKDMVPPASVPTSEFIPSKDATAVHPPKE
jgi:hypothetical protein